MQGLRYVADCNARVTQNDIKTRRRRYIESKVKQLPFMPRYCYDKRLVIPSKEVAAVKAHEVW